MSRTYRRRAQWHMEKNALHDWIDGVGFYHDVRSTEGKARLAQLHADGQHYWMQWRGPAWWRRMMDEVPYRQAWKKEMSKYRRIPDYEPIDPGYTMQYWL